MTCSNTSDRSSFELIDPHEPCGFYLVVFERNNPEHVFLKLEKSSNCMQSFVENLQKLAKEVYEMKQLRRNCTVSPQFPSDQCWLCECLLAEGHRVVDHCHASGTFLDFAHNKCNVKRCTANYIPVFAHIFSKYDLFFISKKSTPFPGSY